MYREHPAVRFGATRTTTELGGPGEPNVDVYRIPVGLEGDTTDRLEVCATLRFDWRREPKNLRGLWASRPPHAECVEMSPDGVERELDVLYVSPSDSNAQHFHIPFWQEGQASQSIPRERLDFTLELSVGGHREASQWSAIPEPQGSWQVVQR